MGKSQVFLSKTLKATIYLLLLTITLECANSARILDEVDPQLPIIADAPEASDPTTPDVPDVEPVMDPIIPLPSGSTALPGGPIPLVAPLPAPSTALAGGPIPTVVPGATVSPIANLPNTVTPPVTNVAPVTTPTATSAGGTTTAATTSITSANPDVQHPILSFFMHDILGGSHPSGRVVTGIVANSDLNGIPFSVPNNQIFPIDGGVPLINGANGIINNNNAPFLVGLNGSPTSIQNNGNNNVPVGGNLPFVTAGQLPSGTTLQQIIFGSITVVDNQLTEGQELGSAVLGNAQGFYLSSSLDGSSHTLVLTALFHGSDHEVLDTVSFFGVHRTASHESQLAVVGGTGKYETAKGYATIVTIPHQDQHMTDGLETITQFSVYLTL